MFPSCAQLTTKAMAPYSGVRISSTNPIPISCPVHHPKQQTSRDDEKWKAEQEKQRTEQAIANTTGLKLLAAIAQAVPVRLLKRDLLFLVERLLSVLDEGRIETLARQHGIRQKRDDGG